MHELLLQIQQAQDYLAEALQAPTWTEARIHEARAKAALNTAAAMAERLEQSPTGENRQGW